MSFIDAHDPAGLVLRVLGVAESTHYDWRARKVTPSRRELDDAVYWSRSSRSAPRTSSPSPTVPHTCAGATPPRRTGRAQTCGAAHAHPRPAGRAPAPRLARRLHSTEPGPPCGAGPGRTRLSDDGTESAVGSRPDPDPHRRGRVVAGQRAGWVRQPDRGLGHRPARDHHAGAHRTQPRPALTRRAARAADLPQRQGRPEYTALRFTQRLVDAGVAPSTGSTGDSYDNALAENLWSTIKVELLYWPGTTFATRVEAEHALIRYIDGWYNPRRIQRGLGGLSPNEYENRYHRELHHPDK